MKSTKHKAVFPTQGQCHSSNRKHGQCVLDALALKHTLAIISDVVAWTNTIHEKENLERNKRGVLFGANHSGKEQ